ncbi:MAG: metallophosphoesterase family protein [Limisphaerales bacterium]
MKFVYSMFAVVIFCGAGLGPDHRDHPQPFGPKFPSLDNNATGEWWKRANPPAQKGKAKGKNRRGNKRIINMDVPRDEVVAFAVYTHDAGTVKMSAQLFPLKPGEDREVRLELRQNGKWKVARRADVIYPGWSAHFRLRNWDSGKDVAYRVRHGKKAMFNGLIRKDPIHKDVIVVGNLSCNSSRTPGPRPLIVENLKKQNPDVLFFAGDQTYHHTQHTAGWLQFGLQFKEIIGDRPVISIPDDHDVGQANIWGESGKKAKTPSGPTGGFYYPVQYVNMVQRHQTWHLPDAYDPRPIQRGIGVYYTRCRVGGIDFAILEDRKFKSGPEGKIPRMGPRPDHINDPKYDRKAVDVDGLKLLGDRQLEFLNNWSQDWTGAEMKAVLSQTAFCGAVHLHGQESNRLLADLDSNAWPQTGRNKALTEIRRAWAPHLCGDQHLAVVVQHGIESHGDGPWGFTSPAIINTIYGRWWHPEDEQAGPNRVPNSPLKWTGDFLDGLGNKISMKAYANPEDRRDEMKRSDGYGIARFDKRNRKITFECWPRFVSVDKGDKAQFPGWPITIKMSDNDGRKITGYLPALNVKGAKNPVVQVIHEGSKDVVYTIRVQGNSFQPPVYGPGSYTVKIGSDKPDGKTLSGLKPAAKGKGGTKAVTL